MLSLPLLKNYKDKIESNYQQAIYQQVIKRCDFH